MTKLEIVYRDYSFFEYRVNEQRLFVDPVFSRYDRGDWVRCWELEPCDYVFVTHRHFDHYVDAVDVLEESDAVLVAAPFVCEHTRRRIKLPRERTLPLRAGERATSAEFSVEAVDSDHRGFRGLWSQLMRRPSEMLALMRNQIATPVSESMLSFLFTFGGLRVQHYGEGFNDVTDFAELEDVARHSGSPDVVVCAADLTFAGDVAEAIEILQPRAVLIYAPHAAIYERFDIRSWPLERFEAAIKRACPRVSVLKLVPDSRYELDL